MAEPTFSGRVLHRGTLQGGCQVLAIDEAAGAVLADAQTGDDGAWTLPAAAGLVFARCRGAALGVVAAPARDRLDLEIEAVAPTFGLTVRIDADGLPAWAQPQVELMPLRIAEVDLRWVTAQVRGMSGGVLARIETQDRVVERAVQAGDWWLGAGLEIVADARTPDTEEIRWHAVAAHDGTGAALEPMRHGFRLTVDGPTTVTITLASA